MNNETIAVVGATGKTGARVLKHLQALGYATRGLSRFGQYHFDWSDRSTWEGVLQGVDAAYVTYFPDLAVPQAEEDIRAFVEVAKNNGIRHIVLLSGRGEEGAERAEQVVESSGIDWNIVRASWFMQNFSESFMKDGIQAGELVLPEPRALEPFIDVDDIAEIVVAALTRPELRNRLLEITGPALLSFAECVEMIATATSREINFWPLSVDTYLSTAKAEGLSEDMAWLINELFVNVLDGRNENTTDTVESILGRPARSFQSYVNATSRAGDWRDVKQQA